MNPPRKVPDKPPAMLDEQIALLRRRGMIIVDEERTKHSLRHLNYYRLRGYWMGFETPGDGSGGHSFRPGTTFEAVIQLYEFDRRLRLEINDAIELFEVSLRTSWAYFLGCKYGQVAHRNAALFNAKHPDLLQGMEKLYNKRKEVFLRHYLKRDEEPPIWVLCEALSLGELSKWLRSLKNHRDRQAIARIYKMHETPFVSCVGHLAYLRNVCAHHARLWNRSLVVATPKLPKKPRELVEQLQDDPQRSLRLYNSLTLMAWFIRVIDPNSTWPKRMHRLIAERSDLQEEMGFPQNWENFELWR